MNDFNQVDKFYEIIDEACMLLYEELDLDYLHAFMRVANDLLEGVNDSKLTKEALEKLESIYIKMDDQSFSNESIRQALNLILAKGLKHNGNYPLDLVEPDSISLLVGNIISHYFRDGVNLFQTNMGLGVQINAIANFLDIDISLAGQEEDYVLASIAKLSSNLQDNDITVFNNSCIDPLDVSFDCLIGHLESKVVDAKFIPYEAITKYMKNLTEDGIFVITIDNDFFNYDAMSFKNKFTGTLLGLILLPDNLFSGEKKRSILVGSKMQLDDYNLFVTALPNLGEGENFVNSIAKIEKWIEDIKDAVNAKLEEE